MTTPRASIGAALSGYALVTLVQAVATFGAVAVFTRLLHTQDYGRYTLAMATAMFLQAMLFYWLHAGMVRFYEKTRGDETAFADHLATSWAALGGAAVIAVALALVAQAWFGLLSLAAAAFMIGRAALTLALEQHRMAGEVRRYAALETGQAVIGLTAGVALVRLTSLQESAPLFGMAIGTVTALLFDLRVVRAAVRGRVSWPHARVLWTYGMPMGLAMLMHLITQLFDRFLVATLIDEAAAGVYAVGYAAADRPLMMIFTWLGMSASPLILAAFERDGLAAAQEAMERLASLILLIVLPAAVGLAMVAEPLSAVLVGREFRGPVVQLLPWIAAASVVNGLTVHYLAVPFVLHRRTGLLAGTMAAAAGLNTVLNLLLIPRLGLWGAALATIVAYALVASVRYFFARRWLNLRLPVDDALRCIAATAAMATGLVWLPLPHGAAGLLPSIATGAVLYATAAWALNAAGCRARAAEVLRRVRRA